MNATSTMILSTIDSGAKIDSIKDYKDDRQLIKAIESLSIKNEASLEKINSVLTQASNEENALWGLVSYDSLFVAFVTISVFGLGYILNHWYQKWLKWKEAKSIRNHFSTWVILHRKIFDDQIINLREISQKLEKSKELQEEHLIVKSFQIEKLLEIPFLKLMNVYVSNSTGTKEENEKAFFNLINSLEFLSSFRTRLFQKYEEFSKGTEQIRSEWNLYFREFDELRISVIRSHQYKETQEGDFARNISEFSANFFTKKNPENEMDPKINLEEWITEYFVPLRNITTSEMSKNSNFLEVQRLASKIEEILIVYKRWKAWKDGFSKIFLQFKESMEGSYNMIEEQINYFNSKKLVAILRFTEYQ
jgi:hypothetical protein